jgi:hypothetical protein
MPFGTARIQFENLLELIRECELENVLDLIKEALSQRR